MVQALAAVGLEKEALHEIAAAKLATVAKVGAAGTVGTTAVSTKSAVIADPTTSTALLTGKGLGLGLGLGMWGPIILAAGIGYVGYRYLKYRKKHLTDEGFLEESA